METSKAAGGRAAQGAADQFRVTTVMEADNAVRPPRSRVNTATDVDPGLSSDSLEDSDADSDTDSVCEERRYQSDLQDRIDRNRGVILQDGIDGNRGVILQDGINRNRGVILQDGIDGNRGVILQDRIDGNRGVILQDRIDGNRGVILQDRIDRNRGVILQDGIDRNRGVILQDHIDGNRGVILQDRIDGNRGVILQDGIDGNRGVILQEEPHLTRGAAEDQGEGTEADTRPRETRSSYSELRYDPNWRNHQNRLYKLDPDEEDALDVSSIDSERWSPDEFTLNTSEDRESPDGHPFWKPLTNVAPKDKKIKAPTKPKLKENGQIEKQGAHRDSSDKKKVPAQGEVSKKDIVQKNKVTLGVRKEKSRSYVHIHKKKMDEGASGQHSEKSDLHPAEEESHLRTETKVSESMEESGLSGIQKKTPKNIHMAGALQRDRMAVYSGEDDLEYMTFSSYPERYRDSLRFGGHYSPEELLLMHHEGLYHHVSHGRHVMEAVDGAEDLMEMYLYPRLSQVGASTSPDPGIAYIAHNGALLPGQMPPPRPAPTSSGEKEAGARDDGGGGSERSCSSGVRKKEGKHYQKRLKSFVNQEVKLGGLGPTHTVSEEKKEQLKQQKDYAKEILERNRNKPAKPREIRVTHNDKSTRQKSLDYAKNVPRPQPLPKWSSEKRASAPEKRASAPEKRAVSCESLLPQIKLLEGLQLRHEKEKMAVAALNTLHVL